MDEIVNDFCESEGEECWFVKFVMPMLTIAVSELVSSICRVNPDVGFPDVVKSYYIEGVEHPEYPRNRHKRLDMTRLAVEYEENKMTKKKTILRTRKPRYPRGK